MIWSILSNRFILSWNLAATSLGLLPGPGVKAWNQFDDAKLHCLVLPGAEIRHTVQMVDTQWEATFNMGRTSVIVLLLLASCCPESQAINGEIVFSIETDSWSYLIYLAHPKVSVFVLAHQIISIHLVDCFTILRLSQWGKPASPHGRIWWPYLSLTID